MPFPSANVHSKWLCRSKRLVRSPYCNLATNFKVCLGAPLRETHSCPSYRSPRNHFRAPHYFLSKYRLMSLMSKENRLTRLSFRAAAFGTVLSTLEPQRRPSTSILTRRKYPFCNIYLHRIKFFILAGALHSLCLLTTAQPAPPHMHTTRREYGAHSM